MCKETENTEQEIERLTDDLIQLEDRVDGLEQEKLNLTVQVEKQKNDLVKLTEYSVFLSVLRREWNDERAGRDILEKHSKFAYDNVMRILDEIEQIWHIENKRGKLPDQVYAAVTAWRRDEKKIAAES